MSWLCHHRACISLGRIDSADAGCAGNRRILVERAVWYEILITPVIISAWCVWCWCFARCWCVLIILLSGTTCVPVIVQYVTTSLLLLSTSYNVSQLPLSWLCDHRVCISLGWIVYAGIFSSICRSYLQITSCRKMCGQFQPFTLAQTNRDTRRSPNRNRNPYPKPFRGSRSATAVARLRGVFLRRFSEKARADETIFLQGSYHILKLMRPCRGP